MGPQCPGVRSHGPNLGSPLLACAFKHVNVIVSVSGTPPGGQKCLLRSWKSSREVSGDISRTCLELPIGRMLVRPNPFSF